MTERGAAPTAWAASGGMWLTGQPGGRPAAAPSSTLVLAHRAATVVEQVAARLGHPMIVDVDEVLFGRAALAGLERNGAISAGGACRLLQGSDGWVAVTLARPDDFASVAAIVEDDRGGEPWTVLATAARSMPASDLAARAQLLGVPAAPLGGDSEARPPVVATKLGSPRTRELPVVVDLSSMWAGPLCAHLLGRAGATVVKVESTTRPDGARNDPAFYRWLHNGHREVTLALETEAGVHALRTLLLEADIVIEGSRPRALRQLGIGAEEIVASTGATWVSITGYGRGEEAADRVAFGDDAAVAGGLVAYDEAGRPMFCGDAIADPLTGLVAAAGALSSLEAGGGHLLDVSMRDVAAAAARVPAMPHTVEQHDGQWLVTDATTTAIVTPPRVPSNSRQ